MGDYMGGFKPDAIWQYIDSLKNTIANLELERDWLKAELEICRTTPTPNPDIHP